MRVQLVTGIYRWSGRLSMRLIGYFGNCMKMSFK